MPLTITVSFLGGGENGKTFNLDETMNKNVSCLETIRKGTECLKVRFSSCKPLCLGKEGVGADVADEGVLTLKSGSYPL